MTKKEGVMAAPVPIPVSKMFFSQLQFQFNLLDNNQSLIKIMRNLPENLSIACVPIDTQGWPTFLKFEQN